MTLDFRSHTEHNNIKIFRLINSLGESIKKVLYFFRQPGWFVANSMKKNSEYGGREARPSILHFNLCIFFLSPERFFGIRQWKNRQRRRWTGKRAVDAFASFSAAVHWYWINSFSRWQEPTMNSSWDWISFECCHRSPCSSDCSDSIKFTFILFSSRDKNFHWSLNVALAPLWPVPVDNR